MATPKHLLSLGAGVQSSTLAYMASDGLIEPRIEAGIFADTKHEPRSVYLYLSHLCGVPVNTDDAGRAFVEPGCYQGGALSFPVHIVSNGDLRKASLEMHRTPDGRLYSQTNIPFFTKNHDGSQGKIPVRGCTRDFKLVPIARKQRELIGPETMALWRKAHRSALRELTKWSLECKRIRAQNKATKAKIPLPLRPFEPWRECQADPLVISWIGISLDEITRIKESRQPWCLSRWPLIELRNHRHDCLLWLERNGKPKPAKSACKFCPFRDNEAWVRMRTEEPFEFEDAAGFESELQDNKAASQNFSSMPFLHRQLVPLKEVDFSTEEDRGQLDMFHNECEGMCGV